MNRGFDEWFVHSFQLKYSTPCDRRRKIIVHVDVKIFTIYNVYLYFFCDIVQIEKWN